ncbi:MAG: DUF2149 domain-containing protein [Planctomycetaceae bacterium]|jgi:hypothetical protein|nr:DUF2149 domain-containing protein [Planctomycetaceae bacterium]
MRRLQKKQKQFKTNTENIPVDPLSHLGNLFDTAMVFAVAFMVALLSFLHIPTLLQNNDYTVITNPGKPNMEIVVKKENVIEHYEATDLKGSGEGVLLGKAYRLPDGRVIYVPTESESE